METGTVSDRELRKQIITTGKLIQILGERESLCEHLGRLLELQCDRATFNLTNSGFQQWSTEGCGADDKLALIRQAMEDRRDAVSKGVGLHDIDTCNSVFYNRVEQIMGQS